MSIFLHILAGLFLWFCVSLLVGPLIGLELARRSQELDEVREGDIVLTRSAAIWEDGSE